jgi:hypothetical protein
MRGVGLVRRGGGVETLITAHSYRQSLLPTADRKRMNSSLPDSQHALSVMRKMLAGTLLFKHTTWMCNVLRRRLLHWAHLWPG